MTLINTFARRCFGRIGGASLWLASALPLEAATIQVFTEAAAFFAQASGVVIEDFDGPASHFGDNSIGGQVGERTTVDVVGHWGDDTRQGLTGTGFFAGEVDSSDQLTDDGALLSFRTGEIFGFALSRIGDNTPGGQFDAQEIGIVFGDQQWLLSDVLGLTDSSNGEEVGRAPSSPVFVGFLSDTAFDGFLLTHGDDVALGGVVGGNEAFWINELALVTAIPLPAGLPLMLAALGGLSLMRRRK